MAGKKEGKGAAALLHTHTHTSIFSAIITCTLSSFMMIDVTLPTI